MTVSIPALATADDDGVALSQKAAISGTNYLVLNGVLAGTTFVANSICASQTPGGAVALTINGTLATTNPVAGAGGTAAAGSATVRFPTPQRIYITGGSDESGKTFAVVGTLKGVGTFGPGVIVTETITGPNASTVASVNLYSNIISITSSAGTAGAITVGHSGTATMDVARRVDITSGGNDTGVTFTVTGTDINGDPRSESLAGASGGAVTTALSYLTITQISTSAAVATTVKIGSSAVADSAWVNFDRFSATAPIAIQVDGSGTVNWTIRQSLNDPSIISNQLPTPTYIWTPASVVWVNHPDSTLVASTTTTGVQGNYAYAPALAKIVLNSGTGSVRATFIQAYMR
jgi:hypothetical protein